jgi:Ca2+-binding EF-hand superfamily protein
MIYASQVFRMFDKDHSGTLDKNEWARAMQYMHYDMGYDKDRLFKLIDRDGSGRINEREFCEFWAVYGW